MAPSEAAPKLEGAARYAAVALGFSIPISTALDNVLLAVILVLWLASGRWAQRAHTIRTNPVALAALGFYALVLAGLWWGAGPIEEGLLVAKKYNDLLLIPILVTLLPDSQDRHRALYAFAAGLVLTLVLSTLLWMDVLPSWPFLTGTPNEPTVFKTRIPHGLLMAFGAFLFVQLARDSTDRGVRALWGVLAAAAIVNVVAMVQGRTGYVVLAGLTVLALWTRLRWKGLAAAVLLVGYGSFAALELSENFHNGVERAAADAIAWEPGIPAQSSVGYRLEFYSNALEIIRSHPLVGVGTSGFKQAYERQVAGTGMAPTRNPHNLYLLIAAQFGLLGAIALLYLLSRIWFDARRLSTDVEASLARGVVLTIALGGLFNSLLIDHTEGLFFSWATGTLLAGLPRQRDSGT